MQVDYKQFYHLAVVQEVVAVEAVAMVQQIFLQLRPQQRYKILLRIQNYGLQILQRLHPIHLVLNILVMILEPIQRARQTRTLLNNHLGKYAISHNEIIFVLSLNL